MRRTKLRRRDGALLPVSVPSATTGIIDWRAINEEQWRTGIQATLGEYGESLHTCRIPLIAQTVVEDDHEEPLED